jgi:hypothetical protein
VLYSIAISRLAGKMAWESLIGYTYISLRRTPPAKETDMPPFLDRCPSLNRNEKNDVAFFQKEADRLKSCQELQRKRDIESM